MTTWRNLTRMPCLFRLFLGFAAPRPDLFTLAQVLSETVEPESPSKDPSSTVNSGNRMGLTAEGRLRTEINPWSPIRARIRRRRGVASKRLRVKESRKL